MKQSTPRFPSGSSTTRSINSTLTASVLLAQLKAMRKIQFRCRRPSGFLPDRWAGTPELESGRPWRG